MGSAKGGVARTARRPGGLAPGGRRADKDWKGPTAVEHPRNVDGPFAARNFARLDESDRGEVDLNEGIQSTALLVRGRAETQGVALEAALNPLRPLTCYPAQIHQVVLNLLTMHSTPARSPSPRPPEFDPPSPRVCTSAV
jgi:hypothetical protein